MHQAVITIADSSPASRARTVRADGEDLITTSRDVLKAIGIEEGATAPPSVLLEQIARFEPTVALERAIKILDYRERTIADLGARLRADGFSADVTETVVGRLAELELVNDARFAELFVRAKIASGWGRRRILDGLKRAGVPEGLAETALCDDAGEPEYERAAAFARRKRPTTPKDTQRVAESLVRRGFGWDVARRATREAYDETLPGAVEDL